MDKNNVIHNDMENDMENDMDNDNIVNKNILVIEKTWHVYLLISEDNVHTYVGASNKPERRLRCHNGELAGGARITMRNRPWRHICIIGKMDKKSALQLEWRLKKKLNRRGKLKGFSGVRNKVQNVYDVLQLQKWTLNARPAHEIPLIIEWHEHEYMSTNIKLPCYIAQTVV